MNGLSDNQADEGFEEKIKEVKTFFKTEFLKA